MKYYKVFCLINRLGKVNKNEIPQGSKISNPP